MFLDYNTRNSIINMYLNIYRQYVLKQNKYRSGTKINLLIVNE